MSCHLVCAHLGTTVPAFVQEASVAKCARVDCVCPGVSLILCQWEGARGVPRCPKCALRPQHSAVGRWRGTSPGAPYLHSRCMGWTPTSRTRPSGRPADACAADSGRRRVSGRPARSAVSSGVLWTVGSETTPRTEFGAVSSGSGVPSLLLLPGLPLLEPSDFARQDSLEAGARPD